MAESFYELTPDEVILAIESVGVKLTGHYMVLNSYENRVYDLKTEGGTHIIAKFYRPQRWSREQIEEEHAFLFSLGNDEIPVCAPLKFNQNRSIATHRGIFFALWQRTGGRVCDELNEENSRRLGSLVARIHNQGAAFGTSKRNVLSGQTYGIDNLNFLITNKFIPGEYEARYTSAVEQIVSIYDHLSQGVPTHIIHGDCHLGNLLRGEQGWFFLDFDDLITGPAVQDLWMLLPARDSWGLRLRESFIQGYEQFRHFDRSWTKLIEPLRALRYINYAGWIARRWDDPAFKDTFSYFGDRAYWERETEDLEKQVQFILKEEKEGTGNSFPGCEVKEEEELTNRNFFWDLED